MLEFGAAFGQMILKRRCISRATMSRYQSSQQSACFRGLPKQWSVVARRLLTHLVFVAALVQFVPVGLTSTRLVADANPDASANESLSAEAHAVDCWATQPTALTRVSGEKSNELEPLAGSLSGFLSTVADLNFLHHWKANLDLGDHRRCLVTLVNLNVRLQV